MSDDKSLVPVPSPALKRVPVYRRTMAEQVASREAKNRGG
jgi:hypothetical protein